MIRVTRQTRHDLPSFDPPTVGITQYLDREHLTRVLEAKERVIYNAQYIHEGGA